MFLFTAEARTQNASPAVPAETPTPAVFVPPRSTAGTSNNPNLAAQAEITATHEGFAGAAAKVADGRIAPLGSRDDMRTGWNVQAKGLPQSLTFSWKEAVPISSFVYYGRGTVGFNVFKDYAVYADGAENPVAQGSFSNGFGPQVVNLPSPIRAKTLRFEFTSAHKGTVVGAAELQIFSKPPTEEDLHGRFTDLSLDYRYAYYPSHNLVRIYLPKPPAGATEWLLALRPAAGGKVLAEKSGQLPTAAGGESMPVPDLPEGDYTLTLTLSGGEETVIEERNIRRERPEWEGNQLGREDVVIPPFTPLEVESQGPVVRSVLRSHTHGPAGLWSQVTSQGRDLLAGPVRLEVTEGGKIITAEGGPANIAEATSTRVIGEAPWKAGALSGTTRFEYDYDGLNTITLDLDPTTTEIDGLQLVIPLKASEAWLMHPVTSMLRIHFAGRIPQLPEGMEKGGPVWNSSGVRNLLNGNFLPYIYVGGPERGICFAAENDKDWIAQEGVPTMVIEREGDTVLLRINLIAKPSLLDRPRSLKFALQATPAKPMPEEPINWRRWWATRTDKDIDDVQIRFFGGNMYWGGRHFATSVYPDRKDYTFWEKMAEQRRTGQMDKEFIGQWLANYDNLPKDQQQNVLPAMKSGFEWSAGTPANEPGTTKFNYLIPYTNPRGAEGETPEFVSTYIDEWQVHDIVDPRWASLDPFSRPRRVSADFPGMATWYQVQPVPSRNDMLLFYHKKMLETFADGIYWDNIFLQPSFVPAEAGGPGYVDDQGRPRAGVDFMGLRELVKRTATMMHVMGKRPLTKIHMTNVNHIPILSFGTLNLDWEWRDQGAMGTKDLQDRISLDEILAHHLGLQSGNITIGMTGNILKGDAPTREWLHRTGMAVCLPHEIRSYQATPEVTFVQSEMARFGYGQPDCKVYRYWEDNFPLQTEGAKMRALVLARDGKAMIALGNFGPEGTGGPKIEAGPSLEEYDAQQLGKAKGPAPAAPAPQQNSNGPYTIRLKLDLPALGLQPGVQAWDLELKANRTKSTRPGAEPLQDQAAELKRVAPGVFEMTIAHHDFALILVE